MQGLWPVARCVVTHLVPQRRLFQLLGIQVACPTDMAAAEGLLAVEAHFEQPPARRRRGPASNERGQPGRRSELLPAHQILAE
ncbi:hypothetical protein DIE06_23865 [Burkholderia sp. Bp8998]|nr:hypothetical protein DIE06_23865 [Burkholderia sp. Bp8998]